MFDSLLGNKQRILLMDKFLPMFDKNSGSHRMFEIVKLLVQDGHDVTYLAQSDWQKEQYEPPLAAMGVHVHARKRPLMDRPMSPMEFAFQQNLVATGNFDVVMISFYDLAEQYIPFVRQWSPSSRILVDTIDLHFVRERRAAEHSGNPADLAKAEDTYQKEIATYAKADGLIAITDVERKTLLDEIPDAQVYTVPNVHELEPGVMPYAARHGLVFVANFWHPPNAEGLQWFVNDVWQRVRASIPTITLDVIGQEPPKGLAAYANHGIRTVGWVPSTHPYQEAARLAIAPLLTGAGMKGKVGDAMACGLPVVTTSIGAEGMGIESGTHALVADTPEGFAHAIVDAYTNAELWQNLSTNGLGLIHRNYTPQAVKRSTRSIVKPSVDASLEFFAEVDWSDADASKQLLRDYVETFRRKTRVSMQCGIIDDAIGANDALMLLVEWITDLGYDPDTIPDISITPIRSEQIELLPRDVIVLTGSEQRV